MSHLLFKDFKKKTIMKKLQAQDFHFYPNGEFKTVRMQDSFTNNYYTDLEETSRSIRIFGTEKQIDNALEDYIKETGLALDESYNFKVEPKGSYWYDIYGSKADEINEKTKTKLEQYENLYKAQEIKKALIIRIG